MTAESEKNYRERVYQIIRAIPPGRVMTYGQIAAILGEGYTPRTVGYVMFNSADDGVPWQRVINSQGKCSTGRLTIPLNLQEELLKAEGVKFNDKGACDLKTYLWVPEESEQEDEIQPSLLS